MRTTLSQLTCLYQFCFVMGYSVICFLDGSYDFDLLGSDGLAMGLGWEERYSGLMARWPAVGWCEGILAAVQTS